MQHQSSNSGVGTISISNGALQAMRMTLTHCALPISIVLIVLAHLATRFLPLLSTSSWMFYVVQPVLWWIPVLVVLRAAGTRNVTVTRSSSVAILALLVAAIQILAGVFLGVFLGFGHSPYNHSPLGLAKGLWFALSIALAREISRWFVVSRLSHRSEPVAVGVTVALFWVTAIPIAGWGRFTEGALAFAFAGSVVLPALASSLFATYLARRSGPIASFAYLGTLAAFEWSSPILPDLSWPAAAIVGVLVPILGFALLEQEDASADTTQSDGVEDGIGRSWIIAGVLLLFVLWFNTGVFGVRPTLVHGISMQPTMHTGDVVITRKVPVDQLEVGDVIRWDQGSYEVLHRIIEIRHEDGNLVFITQGDNNEGPDPPVQARQVEGILVVHVPKVGLPAVWAKRGISFILN